MRWNKIVPCLPMLFEVNNTLKQYETKSLQENYAYLQDVSETVLKKLGYTLHVSGQENIPNEAALFVSNHQGTMDPALIVASCTIPLGFISKKENESIPVLGRCAKSIGTIHFDRTTKEGNVMMLRESVRALKAGHSLCVFAEGTRSKSDQMNPFKEGSLQIAKMAKVTIVPISLSFAYDLDGKCKKHRDLFIHYGTPIPFETAKTMSEEELRNYVHEQVEKHIRSDV